MCGCGGGMPFISTKKKIEILERQRENLKEKLEDIEESLRELKE
jgi:chaperonin cofactor prefoldin